MCSEFFLQSQARRYAGADALQVMLEEAIALHAPLRVRPTVRAPILRGTVAGPELAQAAWGLIPGWAKDRTIARHTFNARAETVHEKPAFRAAFRRRRCLVPVSGWVEWTGPRGRRERRYLHPENGRAVCFAGLWETWAGEGEPLETFTVVTTAAAPAIAAVHDRMPRVLLCADERAIWLEGASEAARALLDEPAPVPEDLQVHTQLADPGALAAP
ncbi:MAG TPA: SOS response-associated peptidase [Xanthomonadaceae bacterium]|nr:SOS response-associated peptidase [Xanthomonadaceae bacterium]